jgi:hypothetical protein
MDRIMDRLESLESGVSRWRFWISLAAEVCVFGAGVCTGLALADLWGWLK